MLHCKDLLPNVQTLLKLFPTLPVTSETLKRTFCVLRRIKTYIKSTISEGRLNGLAITNINKEQNVLIE